MKVLINIFPKKEILDPEAKAIKKSLNNLGFNKINDLEKGKQILISIDENDEKNAFKYAEEMCNKLLVNSTIEDHEIIVLKDR